MDKFKILAIETSCDDTCVSVLENNQLINNIVISSSNKQNVFGGVVPELAAREHEKNIIEAYKLATKDLDNLNFSYVAYTNNPGLRVCLNVGESFAYSLAYLFNAKLLPINHIYGHIFSFANNLLPNEIKYPFLALVASGGHTTIFLVKSVKDIIVLNETSDDAVGEVYDKVARALNLGYPGGPKIDQLFDINKATIKFIHHYNKPEEHFSFSGLKTAVLNYINQLQMKKEPIDVVTIASSFQKEIVAMMIKKIKYYLDQNNLDILAIGGGVSANKYLQEELKKLNINHLYIPELKLCGDNAAMIAIYANLLINFLEHNH